MSNKPADFHGTVIWVYSLAGNIFGIFMGGPNKVVSQFSHKTTLKISGGYYQPCRKFHTTQQHTRV